MLDKRQYLFIILTEFTKLPSQESVTSAYSLNKDYDIFMILWKAYSFKRAYRVGGGWDWGGVKEGRRKES